MRTEKLRNCSAQVHTGYVRMYNAETGEVWEGYGHMLQSYASMVAAIIDGELYTLPRFDYSATTWQHVRKFCEDYMGEYNGCDWVRKGCKHATHYINRWNEKRPY